MHARMVNMKPKAKFDEEVERWTSLYADQGEKSVSWGIFQGYARKRIIERKELCLRQITGIENKRVLEIGCGGGYYGIELVQQKSKWYGIDISYRMLRHCKEMFLSHGYLANLIQGDVSNLPIRGNSFDMILCVGVLSYFNKGEVGKLFNNMFEILVPRGKLITQTISFDPITWVRSRLPSFIPRPIKVPGPLYPHNFKFIVRVLKRRGFVLENIIQLKKFGIFPAGWIYVAYRS